MKILIPTCLTPEQIAPQIAEIRAVTPDAEIFASCLNASASVNRNACLDQVPIGHKAIMIDDDIRGFYPGWVVDLLRGLDVPNSVIASARLLNEDWTFGPTCSLCYDPEPMEIALTPKRAHCILPTAAIAFVNRGHRFDEGMVGSGWEDNSWCAEYVADDPGAVFVQSNRCRLVHLNEAKNQKGKNWDHNKSRFYEKWPKGIPWRNQADDVK